MVKPKPDLIKSNLRRSSRLRSQETSAEAQEESVETKMDTSSGSEDDYFEQLLRNKDRIPERITATHIKIMDGPSTSDWSITIKFKGSEAFEKFSYNYGKAIWPELVLAMYEEREEATRPLRVGFDRGLTAEKAFLRSVIYEGKEHVFIKWRGSDQLDLVDLEETKKKCPEVICDWNKRREEYSRTNKKLIPAPREVSLDALKEDISLEHIVHKGYISGEYCVWMTTKVEGQEGLGWVPYKEAKKRNPQAVLKWYEQRLQLVHLENPDLYNPPYAFEGAYVTERISHAEKGVEGLMFKLHWVGSKASNYVEARIASMRCPAIVFQYYEERLIWPTPESQEPHQALNLTELSTVAHLDPDEIVGATESQKEMVFKIRWKNSTETSFVLGIDFKLKWPEKVIAFYESKLQERNGLRLNMSN